MIFSFPFSSVHQALSWYFNRPWRRPGKYSGTSWPEGDKIQSSPRRDDPEKVWNAYRKIELNLDSVLMARDINILKEHYKHKGALQVEVAIQHDVTDRGIRYIRERLISKVNETFIKAGIVHLPPTEEPVYARE